MAFPCVPADHDAAKEIDVTDRLADKEKIGAWARKPYSPIAHFYKPHHARSACQRETVHGRKMETIPGKTRFCIWCAGKYLKRWIDVGSPPPWKRKEPKNETTEARAKRERYMDRARRNNTTGRWSFSRRLAKVSR